MTATTTALKLLTWKCEREGRSSRVLPPPWASCSSSPRPYTSRLISPTCVREPPWSSRRTSQLRPRRGTSRESASRPASLRVAGRSSLAPLTRINPSGACRRGQSPTFARDHLRRRRRKERGQASKTFVIIHARGLRAHHVAREAPPEARDDVASLGTKSLVAPV
jgi:hypothetical protein